MSNIETRSDLRSVFRRARQLSAGDENGRCIAIVTPERRIISVECPASEEVSPRMLAGIRQIVSDQPKQQITAIANSRVASPSECTTLEISSNIPFLGYLSGMAYDGHTVVVFEGEQSALATALEETTLLLVDEALVAGLSSDWKSVAASARVSQIIIFGRDGSLNRLFAPAALTFPSEEAPSPVRPVRWWWPFGRRPKQNAETSGARPRWAKVISVGSQPIQIHDLANTVVPNRDDVSVGIIDFELTALLPRVPFTRSKDDCVPWPVTLAPQLDAFTFWSKGSRATIPFQLRSDASLRILARNGPITISVCTVNGKLLAKSKTIAMLAMMPIPVLGDYVLVVEGAPDVDWGITVVFADTASI